jgi:hypothetical protein
MPRYHARLAFEPAVLAEVAQLLATHWDWDGALVRGAQQVETPDPWQPRSLDEYALAVCGILAAGGPEAQVMGYLRREEEKLLGAARTTGEERSELARAAWRAVRGIALPPREGEQDHNPAP